MKAILMALAITAIGYGTASAHDCNAKKTVRKHKTTHVVARHTTVQTKQTSICRVIPNQVCRISADRKTVSCYKTTDDEQLTPLSDETIVYGPTGPVPVQTIDKQTIETVVIPGPAKAASCSRDEANSATVCRYPGWRVVRDVNGNYNYSKAPLPWVSPEVVSNDTPAPSQLSVVSK